MEDAARTNAWIEGRSHVTPDGERSLVHGVLRHRLILSYDANADGIGSDRVVDTSIDLIAVPP